MKEGKRFTEEEDTILIKFYGTEPVEDVASRLVGRTKMSVYKRARKLGLAPYGAYFWSPEEDKFLQDNYNELPVCELTKILNRTEYSIIDRATKTLGIRKKGNNKWVLGEEEYVIDNYKKLTALDLARHLNRSLSSVKSHLRRIGVFKNSQPYRRKYECDQDFFRYKTPLASYWAGFFAADGNVTSFRGNSVTLSLGKVDLNHLEKFKSACLFTGPIRITVDGMATLSVTCSYRWKRDLKFVYNVPSRKTKVLKPPDLDWECSLSYIIGYIDGDGHINAVTPSIEIAGTKEVLSWVKAIFCEIEPYCYNLGVHKIGGKDCFRFRVSGGKSISLFNVLNKFNLPRMERKWSDITKKIPGGSLRW